MVLRRKTEAEVIPNYSLTGDLLSFSRCELQYRYHNGSSLPPSRPVQLWFGEFIHGIMESAYRIWRDSTPQFPWPCNPTPYRGDPPPNRKMHDIGTIGDTVETSLRARGKNPRSANLRNSGYRRAERAVNDIGPHLFPLISAAEQKVIGTRDLPAHPNARSNRYELHGVIDVVTNVQLSDAPAGNVIREAIQNRCPNMQGDFEVIVDYKGSRRPAVGSDYWDQGEWQLQTYAWLRMRQAESLPVAAGVLIYINELAPGSTDLSKLKTDINQERTDVSPTQGSNDSYLLSAWRPGNAIPDFSEEFLLSRAIRVIPFDEQLQDQALDQFDQVVTNIEGCVEREGTAGTILGNWAACGDEETCAACDFRYFCPHPHRSQNDIQAPDTP